MLLHWRLSEHRSSNSVSYKWHFSTTKLQPQTPWSKNMSILIKETYTGDIFLSVEIYSIYSVTSKFSVVDLRSVVCEPCSLYTHHSPSKSPSNNYFFGSQCFGLLWFLLCSFHLCICAWRNTDRQAGVTHMTSVVNLFLPSEDNFTSCSLNSASSTRRRGATSQAACNRKHGDTEVEGRSERSDKEERE